MPDVTEEASLLAAVAGDVDVGRLSAPGTIALMWQRNMSGPSWGSSAGLDWLLGAATDADGLPIGWSRQLDALFDRAPRHGARLERFRRHPMQAPVTLACRLLRADGHDVLLSAEPAALASPVLPREAPARVGSPEVEEQPSEPQPAPKVCRFTWSASRAGLITFVSPELAQLVGATSARIVGLGWTEIADRLVADENDVVATALARGQGWQGRSIAWKDVERGVVVPIAFSGTPVVDRSGEITGFRGFGSGLACSRPAHLSGPDVETDARGAEDVGSPPLHGSTTGRETPTREVQDDLRAMRPVDRPSTVSLDGDDAGPPRLTSGDESALREIAAHLQGSEVSPPAQHADGIADRPEDPETADPTALLDALPIPAIVFRDEVPVFANAALLERLPARDLPHAVAEGLLSELEPAAGAPTRGLRLGSAGPSRFVAHRASVSWGDRPATFVLLTEEQPEQDAELEALRLELASRSRRFDEMNAALDLSVDGVVTADTSARLLTMTRSAEALFGTGANEVVGDSVCALVDPRDHRALLQCLDRVRSRPDTPSEECEIRSIVRNEAPALPLSVKAGHLPEGGQEGFVIVFRNLSSARALEAELRGARQAAEEASRQRAAFLARISHEVRTPLTAITGFAELMLEERFGPLGNDRYKGYLADIRESGIHVISLVNDLLDLAKATSGSHDLQPELLDLTDLVSQCISLVGPLASREKTIIRSSFPANLPPAVADRRSVRQIMINLLSNAIRFTGAGGQVIVSIGVRGARDLVISVRDTGPGMSVDEIETALTPFRQVASTRRGDGTGLGLPLSKALAEANGGVFHVTSGGGAGTLVEVGLPMALPPAAAAE